MIWIAFSAASAAANIAVALLPDNRVALVNWLGAAFAAASGAAEFLKWRRSARQG